MFDETKNPLFEAFSPPDQQHAQTKESDNDNKETDAPEIPEYYYSTAPPMLQNISLPSNLTFEDLKVQLSFSIS